MGSTVSVSGAARWPRGVVGVRSVGPSALLVEVASVRHAHALVAWVRATGVDCLDAVPAAGSVLLDGVGDPADVLARLRDFDPEVRHRAEAGRVVVPVSYDGEDLARVARLWGVGVDDVVRRHTGTEFVSAFCGFAPGFAYLAGLPPELAVPRLPEPRAAVPPGAVALADRWCGVYPGSSPGGWLLLGRTDLPVWDPGDEDSPALLAPGTRVRFVVA